MEKIKLVESWDPRLKGFPIKKLTKINESLQESIIKNPLLESNSILYKFPVSRINTIDSPNANGRVYNLDLWRNVRDNQTDFWKRQCGLSDHPGNDSEISFKNSTIVWLDLEIDEENLLVYGIGSFVGPYGALAQDIIDAGGRVGFSSSGFGTFLADGITVDPDTYEIDRLADVVIGPSQGVFGEKNNVINYNKQETSTQVENPLGVSAILGENKKMKVNAIQEKTVEVPNLEESKVKNMLSLAEKKAFKNYINSFLENAANIENPVDKLEELGTILETIESGVLPELEKEIIDEIEKTKKDLLEKIEELEKLKKDKSSLEEKVETSKKVENTLEKENTNLEVIVESLTKKLKELTSENKKLSLKNSIKEKQISKNNETKSKLFVEKSQELDNMKKALIESKFDLEKSKQKHQETFKDLKESIKHLEEQNKLLKNNKISESNLTEDFNKLKNENKSLKEDLDFSKKINDRLTQKNKELSEEIEKFNKYKKNQELNLNKMYKDYKKDSSNRKGSNFFERYVPRRTKEESAAIERYWEDLVKRNGDGIKMFEKEIRGAKTLSDATNFYLSNLEKIDEDLRVARSSLFESDLFSEDVEEALLLKENISMGNYKRDSDSLMLPEGFI